MQLNSISKIELLCSKKKYIACMSFHGTTFFFLSSLTFKFISTNV